MVDYEARLEAELLAAPRTLSKHLFHYTNAEAAIFGILRSETLRLSPFQSTNDLWESRPLHPNLSMHHDDGVPDFDSSMGLWDELDRMVRIHAKVACLTQDWILPSSVANPDALRGWNHLSIWAHYGAGHAGVCLRFDRDKLIEAFNTAPVPDALLRFHGPVEYRSASTGAGPYGVDIGQIREFGLDAVAINYAEAHRSRIFFSKHADWSNESEYRLVLVDQSVLPVEIPIREALTGVFLGDSFPSSRIPALVATLKAYPDIEVFQLRYHNRHLGYFPFQSDTATGAAAPSFSDPPRRAGSLNDRLVALKAGVLSAEQQRARAAALCSPLLHAAKTAIEKIASGTRSWPTVNVTTSQHVTAVTEELRSRAPGVPGEQVHFESGYICVVENLPMHTHTLVAAGAVQILDDDRVRIHAVVTTERWTPDGNQHAERWRETCEVPLKDAAAALDAVLNKLDSALQSVRPDFDRARGL